MNLSYAFILSFLFLCRMYCTVSKFQSVLLEGENPFQNHISACLVFDAMRKFILNHFCLERICELENKAQSANSNQLYIMRSDIGNPY